MLQNLILGIVLVVFAGFFQYLAADLPYQSRLLPSVVLWGIGLCGLLMAGQAAFTMARHRSAEKVGAGDDGEPPIEMASLIHQILIPGATLLIGFVLLTLFGFYIASLFVLFAIFCLHIRGSGGAAEGGRAYLRGAIYTVATTAFMYTVFTLLIGLPAPSGLLF